MNALVLDSANDSFTAVFAAWRENPAPTERVACPKSTPLAPEGSGEHPPIKHDIGAYGQLVDRGVAAVKGWPLIDQRSIDIRNPEYLRTIDTDILEGGPPYLDSLIRPILEERGVR